MRKLSRVRFIVYNDNTLWFVSVLKDYGRYAPAYDLDDDDDFDNERERQINLRRLEILKRL